MKLTAILIAASALTACVSVPKHSALAAARPVFSPITFFSGKTTGVGRLNVILSGTKKTLVHGKGHVMSDGALALNQQIEMNGKPYKMRDWRIQPLSNERYSGTLTTAKGPISGETSGNRLHLRFVTKSGLSVQQWLYLQPDGKTVLNYMTVRKFGIPIASLKETIRKTN